MGDVLAAIGKVREAKQTLRGAVGTGDNVDTSDPGVQLQGVSLPSPTMTDMSSLGMSQAQPGMQDAPSPGISLQDLVGQQPQQEALPPQQAAPVDNPYTTYDNTQNPASDLGSEDDTPITVTGDGWKPPHKEGWLGKAMDVLLMMRGRQPVFKQRKDAENIEDAMHGFQSHPEEAIARVAQVDPGAALRLADTMSTVGANKELAQNRHQDRAVQGMETMGRMLTVVQKSKDPTTMYGKLKPMLDNYADFYGAPHLPDTYDPDQIAAYRQTGTSNYQQAALDQSQQEHADLQADRASDIDLRKMGLNIQAYNAKTERQNSDQRANALDVGTMAQRQAFYKQVLGGAAAIPWLYGGFTKGVFGGGQSGLPTPGTAYVSPDKSMAAKLNANGSWSIYDLSKGTQHAREVTRLGGVSALGAGGGDFDE